MRIETAKTAGFCFGVDRAVKMVEEQLALGKKVVTFGELINNRQVVDRFAAQGVRAVETAEELPEEGTVVIRSHGVAPAVYQELRARGLETVDATCPFVAKIHRLVASQPPEGKILLAGDPNHPEVQGIVGHASAPVLVFQRADELEQICTNCKFSDKFPVILAAQTTFNRKEWQKCEEIIKKVCTGLPIFDTICSATTMRQEEAETLSRRCSLMVVAGGRHSSNTQKLLEICSAHTRAVLVEEAGELRGVDMAGVDKVGITAGASTPACIIKEVQKTMSEILNNQNQEELSFEELLDQSFKSTYTGEKVKGIVTGIAPNEISVDIGTKHAGYLPVSEFTDDPSANIAEMVKKGDELELMVVRVNDVEGTVMLSKKRLDAIAGFEKVMNAVDTGEILEGTVVDVVKGGVLALTNGVKVFIPASQATMSRGQDLNTLLKQKAQFKILEVNRQRRRAVGSIRAVISEQRKVLEEQFWSEVEVGKRYTGTVKSLTSYGAFVDLGGVDGMIHISELSWQRIKHPSQVVKEGDVVEVYVKDIDPEKKKISLGYKKTEDNPWVILQNTYQVGDVASVKVVSMTTFGAFAQLIPGVDGLIHVSQIANERIGKPSDVLSVGEEVRVKITEIDFENKRVSLSIRALLEEEGTEEAAADSEE
ncbi:MAG: bifunctional 4-hydroxy-3-methylbut-2-enyl diphosphate reductase/30S ribosomal protein S1 [Provencibacterium sp.]|nr:bifunctional 4-hydroxy-3-methylbut-2-enyl diphosphate reductase/30S ribosomal protein S1 [Provencibacterium sp.]